MQSVLLQHFHHKLAYPVTASRQDFMPEVRIDNYLFLCKRPASHILKVSATIFSPVSRDAAAECRFQQQEWCYPDQNILHPCAEVDVVCLAGRRHALHDRQMLPAGFAACEQPVFASERDWANCIFGGIVVNVQFWIFQKQPELLF